MAIEVVCPNGHQLKVKDKYAGKSGLCPQCRARIIVPALVADDEELIDLIPRKTPPQADVSVAAGTFDPAAYDDEDALDGPVEPSSAGSNSAGESLLSSSIIKHHKVCPKCYQVAPIWYARCTNCDFFFKD